MTETIDHPAHYQGCSELTRDIALLLIPCATTEVLELECIEVIEHYNLGFCCGNALKYLWRCGQKGDPAEDLQKARWYLERYQQRRGPWWHNDAIDAIDQLITQIRNGGGNETEQPHPTRHLWRRA